MVRMGIGPLLCPETTKYIVGLELSAGLQWNPTASAVRGTRLQNRHALACGAAPSVKNRMLTHGGSVDRLMPSW